MNLDPKIPSGPLTDKWARHKFELNSNLLYVIA